MRCALGCNSPTFLPSPWGCRDHAHLSPPHAKRDEQTRICRDDARRSGGDAPCFRARQSERPGTRFSHRTAQRARRRHRGVDRRDRSHLVGESVGACVHRNDDAVLPDRAGVSQRDRGLGERQHDDRALSIVRGSLADRHELGARHLVGDAPRPHVDDIDAESARPRRRHGEFDIHCWVQWIDQRSAPRRRLDAVDLPPPWPRRPSDQWE